MTAAHEPFDRCEDEFSDGSENLPEARLRAAATDRRGAEGPQDLLRETDEQIARRAADLELDDSLPESRLEAPPGERRAARSAEDLLKDPQSDPGPAEEHLGR